MTRSRSSRWFAVLAVALLMGCMPSPEQVIWWNELTGNDATHEQVVQACAVLDCTRTAMHVAAEITEQQKDPNYRRFYNCREAVDYLFSERPDHARAHKVVKRESNYDPRAHRSGSQYYGCAQLGRAIRNSFLEGPWDDPYWNVKALRSTVDHPGWGWCHWDLVNFCGSGGEF